MRVMMLVRALAVVVVLGGVAEAEPPERTVAIASIEAYEPMLEKPATALTTALRAHAAKRPAGKKPRRYTPKGTPKEIAAATIAAECSPTQRACAATVGTAVGAEFVLAGQLEQRGTHYVLLLSLWDVKTKQRARSLRDVVATTVDINKWSRAVYDRLADVATGDLTIIANAKNGEILLDGQVIAALYDGRATITGLALGTHLLAIRAKGYRPFEVDITIEGATQQAVLLDPEASP
jgi:hypothetical protein